MSHDIIVVGSGVAGMTAAIILSKAGRKVLVLEQARAAGGLMRSYTRSGLRFPIGVHSIGAAGEGQALWRYLDYLDVLKRIRLRPMDREGFEEYCFPDFSFAVPVGLERFRARLTECFPTEKTAIDRFLDDLRTTTDFFPLYALGCKAPTGLPPTSLLQPLRDYLNGLTGCRELKAVLAACNPRYGLPASRCPTYLHFLVLDSYLKSAWRVDETWCPLSSAFESALLEQGGQVRCGTRIAAIECPNRQTQGVHLADGEFITAKTVVFTGNPKQLPALCRDELRPTYRRHLEETKETTGAFVAAIRWEGDRCPTKDRDVYLYNTWDLENTYEQKHLSDDDSPNMIYCSASNHQTNGAFPLTALCLMSGEEMVPWSAGRVGSRPGGYDAVKRQMAEQVVSVIERKWPEQARLNVVDTFTPLTIRDYTLSPAGSCYGLPPSRLTAVTRIAGLHLAGQSIYAPGLMGALLSAVETSGVILGWVRNSRQAALYAGLSAQ